ncbi:MAG TPA: S-methyl-5-thioribose-1-phosphate isomerase [Acidimicrobiales bacterium]|nr:S-methyl-5-thioribose-1-phosphate isomerase [Acidimicrobiales bacterium]
MTDADPIPPTIEWRDGVVRLVDQRRLPGDLVFLDATTVDDLCDAIATLAVRGAPALGVAGAMGVALAAARGEDVEEAGRRLAATRPTAVNLAWGVDRALAAADPVAEAQAVAAEDVARNRRLGAHGAALVPAGARVLTHCNAGGLACAGYGTAIGVIRAAGVGHVWVDETRPLLQGSRITAWELDRLGIPATVVPDVRAGSLLAEGAVDCVVVGADRIAANGDVANKVGTYPLAVLAAHHGVPFYVAAPTSTIDLACPSGAAIPIERRSGDEVAEVAGARVVPAGVAVDNVAFDVTPAALVAAIVTEEGVVRPPYPEGLAAVTRRAR